MTPTGHTSTYSVCLAIALVGSILYSSRTPEQVEPPSVTDQTAAPRPAAKVGRPTFVSPHAAPIAVGDDHVFVVNTPSDTVDVTLSANFPNNNLKIGQSIRISGTTTNPASTPTPVSINAAPTTAPPIGLFFWR